ncbi:MAG: cupin domain-containing protein [Thermomicrobiales bacterium]|nr:cupin domain-containing protein [Thermomicrobiales bacterium]
MTTQGGHDWRPQATPTRQVDNERFIVTEWRFPPQGHTGWHRHAYDYVVVPMTTGALTIDLGNSETVAQLTAGLAYARNAGVEHDVINASDSEFVFVEIEVKS